MMTRSATITCPACGATARETIPDDACVVRWTCPRCRHEARPAPGHCCVFCSHSDQECQLRAIES